MKLWISKFVLINERESSRKLVKIFDGKNLQMTQKKPHTWFNPQKAWRGAAAKHKPFYDGLMENPYG